jgi:hypothetical protein
MRVTAEHLARPPAGDPHHVAFLHAIGKKLVRERMTEKVRVHVRYTGTCSAPADHEQQAVVPQWTALAKPE